MRDAGSDVKPPQPTRIGPPTAPPSPSAPFRATVILAGLLLITMVAANLWMHDRRQRYTAEIARLRAAMTDIERARADGIVASEEDKLRVAIELLRRQARVEQALHLSVSIDTGTMYLERDGALLRAMPVDVGPERLGGIPPDTVVLAAPRGVRTVARVLTERDAWEVPAWVYAQRGVAVDSQRLVTAALGPAALILDGGTIIYSMPEAGPLSDSAYVLPGAVRARVDDLRAILPNILPGTRVYFY
ncbi:MAG: hypothetical protein WD801_14490 [Gemmatimonadaceae bacterium]